jgi:hypothetical protein
MQVRCLVFMLALVSLGSATAVCQSTADSSSIPVLHDGCPVRLTLARTVSSESDQPGELVEFTVRQPVTAGDVVVLPQGASVYGKVVASRLDDRAAGKPGMVEFRLDTLKLANGQLIPLRTIEHLPTDANADVSPESITNLVDSPYAPFGHFKNGAVTTVPKNTPLTLYVAADVAVGAQPSVAPLQTGPSESLATHILNASTGGKSLADIAREQRERGKIGGGMVGTQQ